MLKYSSLFTLTMIVTVATGFAGEPESAGPIKPDIELIGVAEISGGEIDRSGRHQSLGGDFTDDMVGGFSAIEYFGSDDRYYLLSDRGPLDGAVDWACRVQVYKITIDTEQSPPVKLKLEETVLLTDAEGQPFVGAAAAIGNAGDQRHRLDPEGIRVGSNGHLFISDEYGPHVMEFSPDGKLIRELEIPARFCVQHPCCPSDEENKTNETGRSANRGMEGLAVSGDGKTLIGLMQSPLLQDCERTDLASKPNGLNCRMLECAIDGTSSRELLYHLDEESNKLNEALMVGEDSLIVIERDGAPGADARYKRLMLVSTNGASDISGLDQLPRLDVPAGVHPVSKSVLIDLLDPHWNLAGDKMPEKIEGLCFGPDLPDGRRTLLVGSDNDFVIDSPSLIYVFAIPKSQMAMSDIVAKH